MVLVFICIGGWLEMGKMPNARRVCLESTAIPLLLLPVLIALRGILVVKVLRAVMCVRHILLRRREAQSVRVIQTMLVMVLRAAIHALQTLLQLREAHPVYVMQVSAATESQLVPPASPASTDWSPRFLAQAHAPAVSGRWVHQMISMEDFQTAMGITAQMQIAAGSLKHLALTFPWGLMSSIPSLDMIS